MPCDVTDRPLTDMPLNRYLRPGYKWLDPVNNKHKIPDSKVHGANMGPIWGRQDPGGPHAGPMNFAIWDINYL